MHKPHSATSPLGGTISSSLEPKGPAHTVTPRPTVPAGKPMQAGPQGAGGQRKGYGEMTGVQAAPIPGKIAPLPKPGVSKPKANGEPPPRTPRPHS